MQTAGSGRSQPANSLHGMQGQRQSPLHPCSLPSTSSASGHGSRTLPTRHTANAAGVPRVATHCRPRTVIVRAEEFSRQALRDKLRTDDSCLVAFKTRCKVGIDEVMKVVGNVPELGGWNVEAAPTMYTEDGENWILETSLPPGSYDFKCIKYKAGKNGGMGEWERGSDRNIEVSVGLSGMDVACEFGDTSKTKISKSAEGESLDMMRGTLTVPEAADVRVRDMEKTIGTLKQEMQRTETDRARLKDELNKVVVQAIAADQELNRLQSEVQTLISARGSSKMSSQIAATQSAVRDADREVQSLRQALEDKEQQLRKQQDRYESQIREMERAIRGTEDDRQRLKEQLNDMVSQAVQAEEALSTLQAEVREMQRSPRGEEMSKSLSAREEQLRRSEEELKRIKRQLESKSQDITTYTDKLESKIREMERDRKRYDDEMADLRRQLDDRRFTGSKDEDSKMRMIRELQDQLQRTEAERASLKAELNTMVQEAINADQELATLQAEVQRLMAAGGGMGGGNDRTVRLLEEEKAAALNKVSRITAQLEDKEAEFQRFAGQLRDTVQQLEGDKRRMREEIEALERALDDSKSNFSRGQSNERKTIERLEAELRNMEKDRSFLRDEMRGMADVARMAEQELVKLQRDVEQMSKERSATGKSAEQEVFRLQKRMEDTEREVERVKKKADTRVRDLQRQLELSEDDRTRLKKELSSVVMQAMEADKELNKLQAEVKTFVATGGENNPAVARLKEEVLALQREKNIAVADVSRLTERLERTERDIEASKQAMQRAVEALQRQLAQGEEERSRLKKELSEMAVKAVAVEKYQQQMQTLEQDRSMLNSRIKELQRMLGDKESDLKGATSSLRQSLRKLEEEKADALREASNLRSRLADKETELKRLKDSLQATIRSLEEDKSAAGVEVGKLKKAIVALESEKNQALRDVARFKSELEVKETDLRTKTQQIRLLEQDKSTVQRELDQLRASINDGTTEVQRLVARDRRVQEEIVRELQSIKNTLGLAPSGRSSPLYEALTNAEIKSERSAKKTAAVIDRILEPAKARAAGLREPLEPRSRSPLDGDNQWWGNLVASVTGRGRRDPLDGRLDRRDDRRDERRDDRREDRRDDRQLFGGGASSRESKSVRESRRRDMLVDDDLDVDAVQWTVLVAAAVALPTVVASEYTINATSCCGLPSGPYGLLGNLEAASYLTVLSIIAWSVYRRLFRGKEGLPAGPYGALPAVEGLSYAALIGGIVVVSVQILGNGWVPGAPKC